MRVSVPSPARPEPASTSWCLWSQLRLVWSTADLRNLASRPPTLELRPWHKVCHCFCARFMFFFVFDPSARGGRRRVPRAFMSRTPARRHLPDRRHAVSVDCVLSHLGPKSRAAETPPCAKLHGQLQKRVKRSRGPAWQAHDCLCHTRTPNTVATWACALETTTCAGPEGVMSSLPRPNGPEHIGLAASTAYLRRACWLPHCRRSLDNHPLPRFRTLPHTLRVRVACANLVLASLILLRRSHRPPRCAARVCGRSARSVWSEWPPTSRLFARSFAVCDHLDRPNFSLN